MFGVAEILALGGSLLLLLLVVIAYIYFLVPARSRRETLQRERANLQTQLGKSQDIIRQDQNTQTTVTKITESLDAFQSYRLSNSGEGRMGLYGELNQLIRKNASTQYVRTCIHSAPIFYCQAESRRNQISQYQVAECLSWHRS